MLFLPCGHGEFAGGGDQLRLAALVQEVPYDLRVGHVLPGGVVGGRAGDQAAFAIHHIGRQPAAVDFLQAANQELQIFYRADHAEEASAIHHGSADQHHGAGRFSAADHQGLAAIGAAFTGGVVGAYQVALQKGVGSDASGRNALGFRIQQRGIGQIG